MRVNISNLPNDMEEAELKDTARNQPRVSGFTGYSKQRFGPSPRDSFLRAANL